MASDLIKHFSLLKDPRIERNKSHALIDIVVLAICAVASGADGWEGIEQFGRNKLDWLRQYIRLAKGVCSLSRLHQLRLVPCISSTVQGVLYALDTKRHAGNGQ